jgi:hypothetical protein
MISIFLLGPHFVAAQQVWTFTGYGTMDFLHYGNGDSSITFTTDTDWVSDRIDVITGSGGNSVLDQHIYSDPSRTNITRNALYIGPGSIETSTTYYGSNVPGGEDSITGIYLTGDSYGALIQNGSLEFSADFGGISESAAVAGSTYSTYSVEQFGFVDTDGSGDFTQQVDHGTFVGVSGDYSATVATFDFGSVPQPGPDTFHTNSMSWATGEGYYSFYVEAPSGQLSTIIGFGQADILIDVDSDIVEGSASFDAN